MDNLNPITRPPGKPLATLTKKAFAQIQKHIAGNLAHEGDTYILDVVAEAIRLSTGFDPDAKTSAELIAQKVASHKKKAAENGNSVYEQYTKPRRQALKQKYPNVPAHILSTKPLSYVEQYAASH